MYIFSVHTTELIHVCCWSGYGDWFAACGEWLALDQADK